MHRATKCSCAFAVNQTRTAQAAFTTRLKVGGNQFTEISRTKCVQIELAGNRERHGCFVLLKRRAHGEAGGGGGESGGGGGVPWSTG